MKSIKYYSIRLLLVSLLFIIYGCESKTRHLFGSDIIGRVIDADTSQPISNAFVVIKYELYKKNSIFSIPMDHSHKGGCVWNTVVKTDDNGNFNIPALPDEILKINSKLGYIREYISYSAYKNGYTSYTPRIIKPYLDYPLTYAPHVLEFPSSEKDKEIHELPDFLLIKNSLTAYDRFNYLSLSTYSKYYICDITPELKIYFEAILEEMKSLDVPLDVKENDIKQLSELMHSEW